MKVKELIELLKAMPQDAETMVEYNGYYEAKIKMVEPYIELISYRDDGAKKVVIADIDARP